MGRPEHEINIEDNTHLYKHDELVFKIDNPNLEGKDTIIVEFNIKFELDMKTGLYNDFEKGDPEGSVYKQMLLSVFHLSESVASDLVNEKIGNSRPITLGGKEASPEKKAQSVWPEFEGVHYTGDLIANFSYPMSYYHFISLSLGKLPLDEPDQTEYSKYAIYYPYIQKEEGSSNVNEKNSERIHQNILEISKLNLSLDELTSAFYTFRQLYLNYLNLFSSLISVVDGITQLHTKDGKPYHDKYYKHNRTGQEFKDPADPRLIKLISEDTGIAEDDQVLLHWAKSPDLGFQHPARYVEYFLETQLDDKLYRTPLPPKKLSKEEREEELRKLRNQLYYKNASWNDPWFKRMLKKDPLMNLLFSEEKKKKAPWDFTKGTQFQMYIFHVLYGQVIHDYMEFNTPAELSDIYGQRYKKHKEIAESDRLLILRHVVKHYPSLKSKYGQKVHVLGVELPKPFLTDYSLFKEHKKEADQAPNIANYLTSTKATSRFNNHILDDFINDNSEINLKKYGDEGKQYILEILSIAFYKEIAGDGSVFKNPAEVELSNIEDLLESLKDEQNEAVKFELDHENATPLKAFFVPDDNFYINETFITLYHWIDGKTHYIRYFPEQMGADEEEYSGTTFTQAMFEFGIHIDKSEFLPAGTLYVADPMLDKEAKYKANTDNVYYEIRVDGKADRIYGWLDKVKAELEMLDTGTAIFVGIPGVNVVNKSLQVGANAAALFSGLAKLHRLSNTNKLGWNAETYLTGVDILSAAPLIGDLAKVKKISNKSWVNKLKPVAKVTDLLEMARKNKLGKFLVDKRSDIAHLSLMTAAQFDKYMEIQGMPDSNEKSKRMGHWYFEVGRFASFTGLQQLVNWANSDSLNNHPKYPGTYESDPALSALENEHLKTTSRLKYPIDYYNEIDKKDKMKPTERQKPFVKNKKNWKEEQERQKSKNFWDADPDSGKENTLDLTAKMMQKTFNSGNPVPGKPKYINVFDIEQLLESDDKKVVNTPSGKEEAPAQTTTTSPEKSSVTLFIDYYNKHIKQNLSEEKKEFLTNKNLTEWLKYNMNETGDDFYIDDDLMKNLGEVLIVLSLEYIQRGAGVPVIKRTPTIE